MCFQPHWRSFSSSYGGRQERTWHFFVFLIEAWHQRLVGRLGFFFFIKSFFRMPLDRRSAAERSEGRREAV